MLLAKFATIGSCNDVSPPTFPGAAGRQLIACGEDICWKLGCKAAIASLSILALALARSGRGEKFQDSLPRRVRVFNSA
jgi:hypothetical protein